MMSRYRLVPCRPLLVGLLTLTASAAAQEEAAVPDRTAVVEALSTMPVSRLEWAMLRIERYLEDELAIDPTTLEPYRPPFFINLEFDAEAPRLIIEIGRTFGQLDPAQAAPLCRDYVNKVRILFNVDRVGQTIAKPYSTLAPDFFLPPDTVTVDPALARGIDELVAVRGLVASPITGAYSVCGTAMLGSEIRFLD